MDENINKTKAFIFDWIIPIAVAILVAVLINKFLLFKIKVPTGSMIPTVEENDQIFVTRVYNPSKLERGDIIVFKSKELNDEFLLKRLIGLPGDKVDIKNDGKVYINGELLDEPYVKNPSPKEGSFVVPEGKYFMLGDNRAISNDARYWKEPYIDGKDIEAKAGFRIYPFNRIGVVK